MPKHFQFCCSDPVTDGKFLRQYYRLYVDDVRRVNGFQSVTPKQGLTGSRYPTRPELFFKYPTRPDPKIENDWVPGN